MKRFHFLALIFFVFYGAASVSSEELALVLSGGGAKGAYEVGVWKAVSEYGLADDVSLISGTSVGALNAALFACSDAASAEALWRNRVSYDSFLKPDSRRFSDIARGAVRSAQNERGKRDQEENPYNLDRDSLSEEGAAFLTELLNGLMFLADTGRGLVKGASDYISDYALSVSHSDGLFSRDALEQIIDDRVSLKKLQQSGIEVYASALEKDGALLFGGVYNAVGADKSHYFKLNEQLSDENVKSILMASSSFPLLYSSWELSGDVLENGEPLGESAEFIDGGFTLAGGKNTPVRPAVYTSKISTVLVVYLKSEEELAAAGERLDRSETGDKRIIEIIPSEALGDLESGTLNFSKENISHLIDLGYADAVRVLEKNGYRRPSKIKSFFKRIFK